MDENNNQQPGGSPPSGDSGGGNSSGSSGGSSSSSVTYSANHSITAATIESDQTYNSSTADENSVLVSLASGTITLSNPTVEKTGDSDGGDNCNFYGINSAIMATGGGNLSIVGGTVTADATGANGVFSYGGNGGTNGADGDGTTIYIENTTVNTTGDNGGGIMTTGGGKTIARNLTVTTTGNSSAPIRTDRGGGNVTVNGGSYESSGTGSPAIYSTADIVVNDATLISNHSEGVCIEGQNSVALTNCTLSASNDSVNGQATFKDTIMIYQSQSGDAADGTSTFSMTGGILNSSSGHVFHVTNTTAIITLSDVTINDTGDGVLLSVCDDGWSGASNIATLNASGQVLSGDILVGDDSTLTLNISDSSTFTGNISGSITNASGTSVSSEIGTVNVSLDASSKWYLTGDASISSFEGTAANVITGDYSLYVNGNVLDGTSESDDDFNDTTTDDADDTTADDADDTTADDADDTTADDADDYDISNSRDSVLVNGTSEDDSIYNSGENVTINSSTGDDYIYSSNGTFSGAYVTINADAGNDTITGRFGNSSISGGEGNDLISMTGDVDRATINPGTGNDSVYMDNVDGKNIYQYTTGDGNDSIYNWNFSDTLMIDGEAVSIIGNTIISVGDDSINLSVDKNFYIFNSRNSVSVEGTSDNDSIYNGGSNVTINAGTGSDSIENDGNNVLFQYSAGNDLIEGFTETSTLSISSSYSTAKSDTNFLVTVGDDVITLKNAYISIDSININDSTIALDNAIELTEGNDSIEISRDSISINALGGDDSIRNYGDSVTIDAGAGSDYIYSRNGESVSINAGVGNDSIDNLSDSVTIDAGAGNDYIYNDSDNVLFQYSAGNDLIEGFNETSTLSISNSYSTAKSGFNFLVTVGDDVITLENAYATTDSIRINDSTIALDNAIELTEGNDSIIISRDSISINALGGDDSIRNYGDSVIINAGAGNDSISNYYGYNVTINAGAGNDSISSEGDNVTINAGAGNDSISSEGDNVLFQYTSGNDTIIDFSSTDTLLVNGEAVNVTGDTIISVGDGSIDLSFDDEDDYYDDAADDADDADDTDIYNSSDSVMVNGTDEDDYITNYGSNVTINAGAGNDSISNYSGDTVTINAGEGNDSISNYYGYNVSINAGAGDDYIYNNSDLVSIDAGDGNDSISNYYGYNVSINAGAGNDSIENDGSNVTIDAGAGNDSIENDGDNVLFQYSAGNDLIEGFNETSTLSISGSYSTAKSGSDFLVTVGDSVITLKNAYTSIDSIHINDSTIALDNAIELTEGNDSIEISRDSISVNSGAGNDSIENRGDSVTIDAGTGSDFIENYGDNVLFQYSAGNDLIEGFTETSTLSISSSYSTAKSGSDFLVTVSDDVITLKNAYTSIDSIHINDSAIALDNAIELTEGNDSISIYRNSISVNALGGDDSIRNYCDTVSIDAGAGNDTIDNRATLNAYIDGGAGNDSIVNSGDSVTIDGSTGNDSIDNIGENVTINAGVGNDFISLDIFYGNNVIVYSAGNDTITGFTETSTLSISNSYSTAKSGSNFLVTVGDDVITLENAYAATDSIRINDSTIALDNAIELTKGNDSISIYRDSISVNALGGNNSIFNHGDSVIINAGAGNDSIFNDAGDNVTINAGAGNDSIENYDGDNVTINAGAGNDSISSEGDNVLFQYTSGNDTIIGFNETDTLLVNGEAVNVTGDTIISVGDGSIDLSFDDEDDYYDDTADDAVDDADDADDTADDTADDSVDDTDDSDIFNSSDSVSVNGTDEGDFIFNTGSAVTINALGGSDSIINNVDDANTSSLEGTSINAGSGDDYIYNHHSYYSTLLGGTGDDYILVSRGHRTFIDGGSGNDSIIGQLAYDSNGSWRMGGYATINGGAGDDYINPGYSNNSTINAGDGNDTIINNGISSTLDGGAGYNLIQLTDLENSLAGQFVVLNGQTTVEGFQTGFDNGSDTVYIAGDAPAVDFKDEGLSLYYDDDPDNYLTFAGLSTTAALNLYYAADSNLVTSVFIADNQWYQVSNGAADYYVGATALINHGIDFGGISDALNVSLDTDYAANVDFWINNIYSIKGGDGLTTITGSNLSDTIIAGTGATTINAGAGDDFISLNSSAAFVRFNDGDGNDSIAGFNDNSTLLIDSSYSTAISGSNVLVTVGDDTITLAGAASLDSLNILDMDSLYVERVKALINASAVATYSDSDFTNGTLDLTKTKGSQEVSLSSGNQTLKFNNDGGNLAIVEDGSGKKSISLGSGGDAVIHYADKGQGSSVNVSGGKGDDTLVAFGTAPITFDMSKGGADKITPRFNGENIILKGYKASNGGGIVTGNPNAESIIADLIDGDIICADSSITLKSDDGTSAKVTFADNSTYNIINIFDANDEAQPIGVTNRDGGSINVSTSADNYLLVGNYFDDKYSGSTLIGGNGNDTLLGGEGDFLNAGGGNANLILLADDDNRDGASIVLSEGKATVQNFNAGFEGDRLYFGVNDVIDFKFDGSNVSVNNNNAWRGVLSDVADGADFVNLSTADSNSSIKVVAAQANATITVDDELADYYIGDNSAVDFTNYDGALNINLGSAETSLGTGEILFTGINQLAAGSGQSTLRGSANNETLYAGSGNATLYGGGGRNLLANSSEKDGATEFMLLGDANGARSTIQGFEFLASDNSVTADKIDIGNNFVSNVFIRNDTDVSIEVSNSETAIIQGAVGQNFKVGDYVAQVNTNDLKYDGAANFFVATQKNASITVGDVDTKVVAWLGNQSTAQFIGDIRTLDATSSTVNAELAGNDLDNTICAGGGNASLWGGNGGDDLLQGGSGQNLFFYTNGNGNDTISGANAGDVVYLSQVTFDNLASTNFNGGSVAINFKDGGKLTVNDATNCDFVIGDQTYYVNGNDFTAK